MIRVSINGETQALEAPTSVSDLLTQSGYEARKVAVAINTDFVPRSQYDTRLVQADDQIDILAAVQGG